MASEKATATSLERDVETFLQGNLPQIAMHGGDASVLDVDPEAGRVRIRLAGACSGCGISPMTIQAITNRLPAEVPGIDEVVAETGTVEPDRGESGGEHHGMGHPAGGGVSLDYEGEIPDWRKDD